MKQIWLFVAACLLLATLVALLRADEPCRVVFDARTCTGTLVLNQSGALILTAWDRGTSGTLPLSKGMAFSTWRDLGAPKRVITTPTGLEMIRDANAR